MKEGRLKGQAFVKMGSIERAVQALKEVNGYLLYEKPIVIVNSLLDLAIRQNTE